MQCIDIDVAELEEWEVYVTQSSISSNNLPIRTNLKGTIIPPVSSTDTSALRSIGQCVGKSHNVYIDIGNNKKLSYTSRMHVRSVRVSILQSIVYPDAL